MREYQHLLLDLRTDGVLLITINRPDRYNAADETLHRELAQVWTDVAADDAVRVAVITGAGEAFCAGGDLDMVQRQSHNVELTTRMLSEASDVVLNMVNCTKPIISAINGVAVGAGLAVALLADISVMASDAHFSDGHLRLGVSAGDHAALIWPLLCSMAKAKYYLFTGEFITGAEAERIGLVSKAVDQDLVLTESLEIADRLAAGPQTALRWTKRSMNHWIRAAIPAFEASLALEMLSFFGDDIDEGIRAVREKRAPRFPSTATPTTDF